MHDFPQDAVGQAVHYGIYDLQHNRGTVYVSQSADTSTFAVDNIAHWYETELPERFPGATRLMIEADGGGSMGRIDGAEGREHECAGLAERRGENTNARD